MTGYKSISASIRSNGDRHFANACRHGANGDKEYAFGSYRKAKRNWSRADEFDRFMYVPPVLRPAYDAFRDAVTERLYSVGAGSSGGLNHLLGETHG